MKLATDFQAKVLIIDDNAEVRNAIRVTLESELDSIFSITEAHDVESGLKAVKSSKPDVVLLDLHMPGKNGFDFLDELRSNKAMAKTKVVVVTAHGSMKNLLKAQSRGISNYQFMNKPFRSDELLAVVLSAVLPEPA